MLFPVFFCGGRLVRFLCLSFTIPDNALINTLLYILHTSFFLLCLLKSWNFGFDPLSFAYSTLPFSSSRTPGLACPKMCSFDSLISQAVRGLCIVQSITVAPVCADPYLPLSGLLGMHWNLRLCPTIEEKANLPAVSSLVFPYWASVALPGFLPWRSHRNLRLQMDPPQHICHCSCVPPWDRDEVGICAVTTIFPKALQKQ